ncbi:4-carboxymuconolactone decarboxylase [Nesterenkonia ebinurensis]|uniref:4-carboxymuconolactone decarboxylase n=1 Tax=Nesterenkonia ebinurensis TaxID=2608252 RepID=UPI00123E06A4|nr:4-carboxymuconolactone decarboxylase [Nesterenkonia ebinurensis]
MPDSIPSANEPEDRTYQEGMRVRREVLSDAHVDRAQRKKDEFTRDFQELITRYAWGTIWTRPGLPRTTRSAITLTAMIAGGYWEELEMHVRAAVRNGMTAAEIKEVFLQSAIYCSVPAANVAFGIGQRVLAEELGEGSSA